MTRREDGVALMFALLVLVVLSIVSGALLFVATQEAMVVAAGLATTRARLDARSAAHLAIAGWSTEAFRDLPVGEARDPAPAASTGADTRALAAEVERLAGPWFLIHARARPARASPEAESRVGVLVRALDPLELWEAFPAAVTAGGEVRVTADARITGAHEPNAAGPDAAGLDAAGFDAAGSDAVGSDAVGPDPAHSISCPAAAALAPVELFGATHRPGVLVPDLGSVSAPADDAISGAPPVAADTSLRDAAAFDRIGPLHWDDLRRLADRSASGTVTPMPRIAGGECDLDAGHNWGDPLNAGSPCAGFAPLVFAPGDLHLAGGVAQGVFAIGGDLVLDGGAQLHGAVFVRGSLRTEPGTAIVGAVRAGARGGPASVAGAVAYDACALWLAFTRPPALNRPFRQGPRTWIPIP